MEKLGNITLINGDCMDYMKSLPDNAYNLAIVDPPYGVGMDNGHNHCRQNPKQTTVYKKADWDIKPPKEYFDELRRVSKEQVIFGANYFIDLLDLSGWSWFLWDKKQPQLYNLAMGELAAYSGKKPLYIFQEFRAGNCISNGDPAKAKAAAKIHPCEKPVRLYKWILETYAKKGDTILDTHFGSGSIAIAAHDYGFELTGIEIDKDYYEAAKKRLTMHQKQQKLFT